MVFTSQGIPFIYAGEEIMRDKQGVDNSYKSPDAVNAIDWRRKTTNGDVFMYYKRLIDLRKSHPAFRMGDAGQVRKHLEFLPVEGSNLIAFRLKDHANGDHWEDIIVAFNSRPTPARLTIPVGKYTVVCKDGVIDVRGLGIQNGPEVIIPGQSALILYGGGRGTQPACAFSCTHHGNDFSRRTHCNCRAQRGRKKSFCRYADR